MTEGSQLASQTTALIFDFGNTIVEFGPKQFQFQNDELLRVLEQNFGSCDRAKLKEIRDRQIVRPFSNGYRENHLPEICAEIIRELYELTPSEEHVELLVQTRYRTYLDGLFLTDEVASTLEELHQHYRLALLSNYPVGDLVRQGIDQLGIGHLFDAMVVSADVGYVKPHALPFERVLEELHEVPERTVYIGDNWLADVQGAKRKGMSAIHTSQFMPYERFKPKPGDYEPDERIQHLQELLRMFVS